MVRKNERGITLIALVISIIVLLILAGITILAISGENGIIQRAVEAREETEEAKKTEQNTLNSYEDTINEYIGIDWDTALANAEKHPDQKTSTAIGVGTNGRAVNMDLWEYTLLEDNTYALNDEEALNDTKKTPGYQFGNNGENVVDGKIIGTIPQYISTDNGTTFKPVTDLTCTFSENSYLVYAPYIPSTVTKMVCSFIRCSNLTTIENLPSNLKDLSGAFKQTTLKSIPYLPDTIINLSQTFYGCNELTSIKNIPQNIIDMSSTFEGCMSLTNITLKIPNSATNIQRSFANCEILSGEIVIEANITGQLIGNNEDYSGIFGNAVINSKSQLTVKCSENVYNIFYDDTRPNHINQLVASWNSNIILERTKN